MTATVIAADSSTGSDQTLPSSHEDALTKTAYLLRQAELRQEAVFAIAALAGSGRDLQAILGDMHRIVVDLLSPQSFVIALYDAGSDFATYIGADLDSDGIAMAGIEHALAWHMVRDRLPIRGSGAQLSEIIPTLSGADVDTVHWAGVPLVEGDDVQGALLLRARADQPAYGNSDISLLTFIGSQVLVAMDRWRAQQLAEADLQDRNEDLVQEVMERQRSERLQAALFSVSELSNTTIGLSSFYAAVHDIIGDVVDCRNICVAQIARDVNELQFPYYVNDRQPIPAPRPPGRGIIEYVLRTHCPLRIDMSDETSRAEMAALVGAGEISSVDVELGAWLGVPLVCANHVIGVLSVQTYESGMSYDDRDEEFLSFISYQIGNALERQQAAASLRAANATLEQRVSERTRQLQNQMEAREQIELQLKHETLHDLV